MSKAEDESTGDYVPIRAQNHLGSLERVPQTREKSDLSYKLLVMVD